MVSGVIRGTTIKPIWDHFWNLETPLIELLLPKHDLPSSLMENYSEWIGTSFKNLFMYPFSFYILAISIIIPLNVGSESMLTWREINRHSRLEVDSESTANLSRNLIARYGFLVDSFLTRNRQQIDSKLESKSSSSVWFYIRHIFDSKSTMLIEIEIG